MDARDKRRHEERHALVIEITGDKRGDDDAECRAPFRAIAGA
jgi:hypothetical protein